MAVTSSFGKPLAARARFFRRTMLWKMRQSDPTRLPTSTSEAVRTSRFSIWARNSFHRRRTLPGKRPAAFRSIWALHILGSIAIPPALLGVTGQQARGDVNYRLTRKTTIGTYYSFSHYLYPHGFGNSDTNTAGLIYSYAFSRTMQIRLRGGLSRVESLGLQSVEINPVIAALLGQSSGIVDS